jgi:hypothetical protein
MENMNMFWGINTSRLEKVEERLKADVIKEADAMGGLILAHQELCKHGIRDGTCFFSRSTICF